MHQCIHWDLHQHLHFNVPLFLDSLHHILLPNWLSSSNLLIFIHIFVMINTLIETQKLQSSFPSYILYPKTVQMSFIFIDIFVQAEHQTDIFIESCKKSHFLYLLSGSHVSNSLIVFIFVNNFFKRFTSSLRAAVLLLVPLPLPPKWLSSSRS